MIYSFFSSSSINMSIIFTVSTLLSSSLFKQALMYSSSLIWPSLFSSISSHRALANSSSVAQIILIFYSEVKYEFMSLVTLLTSFAFSRPCKSFTNFFISDFEMTPSLKRSFLNFFCCHCHLPIDIKYSKKSCQNFFGSSF